MANVYCLSLSVFDFLSQLSCETRNNIPHPPDSQLYSSAVPRIVEVTRHTDHKSKTLALKIQRHIRHIYKSWGCVCLVSRTLKIHNACSGQLYFVQRASQLQLNTWPGHSRCLPSPLLSTYLNPSSPSPQQGGEPVPTVTSQQPVSMDAFQGFIAVWLSQFFCFDPG